jgi:ketosteroid isomerase-like protein
MNKTLDDRAVQIPAQLQKADREIIDLVQRFNDLLNARKLDEMMAMMTADCLFDNTYPPPEGNLFRGQAAVRAFWEEFFQNSSQARFDAEEIFACGDRCVMRWRYTWMGGDGRPGTIRGVDIYRIEGDLIAEKRSYVKG